MEAWQQLVARLIAEHPFIAPLFVFWWQAAFQDVLSFLKFRSWGEFCTWDWRRATLSWAQGVLGGVLGVAVATGASAVGGSVAGLVTFGVALAIVPRLAARSRIVALLAVATIGSTACASLPLKQRAVVGLEAAHASVAAAQDAERALYAAKTAGITPVVHGRFADFFERYFVAEVRVAATLKVWRSGDPPPTDLAEAVGVLREALGAADALTDGAEKSSLVGKINDGIARVQAVLDALGGVTQ